ncbi:glycoside hydrolase [Lentinus tigrinus ALCF2SS1-7]|uniref:beta-N-acetylhexosaminidase n=1 Tax=Lentinus tigrinus ALCF2SS1-6 TaxID=1328759 RepID=A0A5C2STT4_9APHY|nr:glycoside hydrolase [Lentinus tigrinus ALCF2SS1-6]RPD82782.1 glycoside hydrolase [Lentinus tigrinus ALCF2SS1-7]
MLESIGLVAFLVLQVQCSVLEPQIPSVASFTPSSGTFELSPFVRIVVDSKYATHGSPSLLDYADTFRSDLEDTLSYTALAPVKLSSVVNNSIFGIPTIYLTLNTSLEYKLYNGQFTDEGYDLQISRDVYLIKGSTPLGVWWGTRTLLQQGAIQLAGGAKTVSFPAGEGSDSPGWEVRGFMLDAGRHWFDTSFLGDLCIYASYFKLNEMHLHASDNLWNPAFLYGDGNEGWKSLYAAFRFQPPAGSALDGLVPRKNESWTQQDFLDMQRTCADHGVTIIPEVDTPGHSLVINQWKSELMENGAPDHLNLSYPDTIPTIKSIWDEFLPWFSAPEVSIGADEYDSALANDYISFVNEMSSYIGAKSNKSIRIWGTNEPSTTLSVSKDITSQHWDFPGDDVPVQLLSRGYRVINSEQAFLYLDGKTSDGGQFPQELNQDLLWSGAPGGKGWAPNIFSPTDPTNNTSIDAPNLRGAVFALWNDWGNNATTALEVYYQLARSMSVFGEKAWAGSDVRPTGLTRDQFDAVYPMLNAAAPGQNLNRVVKPKLGNIVYEYPGTYRSLNTGIPSVGPPYTLSFSVKPDSRSPFTGTLFSGADSKLHVANLTFEATGQLYALGYVLPQDRYTSVEIHATREYTYALIDGDEANPRYWHTLMDIWGEYMALGNMSFAAPSAQMGGDGFAGIIKDVRLRLGA